MFTPYKPPFAVFDSSTSSSSFYISIAALIAPTLIQAALVTTDSQSSTSPTDLLGDVSGTDLAQSANVTGPSGVFGNGDNLKDGVASSGTTSGALYLSGGKLPATYTFDLDTTASPEGYDISSIISYAGWSENGPALGNQRYTLEIATVDSPTSFSDLGTFEFLPFGNQAGAGVTKMVLNDDEGSSLDIRVSSIRMTFLDHGFLGPNTSIDGTVYYEVDIIGTTTGQAMTVQRPTERTIVQRNSEETGNFEINGIVAKADRVEARALPLDNSGADTGWQIIDSSPSGGVYSGTLFNVAAGGWYELSIRSITSEVVSETLTVTKVGVGDIFITAGQSNSANHGSPVKLSADDRAAARASLADTNWVPLVDPIPIATGTGGSPWSRFVDLYVESENVPVGIMAIGVGSSPSSSWRPQGGGNYNRLRTAVQSFPANGFKAILWHQGESDSLATVTAAQHQTNLEEIISGSRTDAGWNIPWYISEAAYHNDSTLSQEMPVNAGQRATAYADSNVHLGPRTDDFHLEGKLWDLVHFNEAGLTDHATQWHKILTSDPNPSLKNADIEANVALSDGGIAIIDNASVTSPSVIAWEALAASGVAHADGFNGYFNPDNSFYTGTLDSANGGVVSGMNGKHIAFLFSGTAGNYFQQTFRARLKPNTEYSLTVALGRRVRGTHGGARIEILANGKAIATTTTLEADLPVDAFTDVTTTFLAPDNQVEGHELAVRINKIKGINTYVDFDNVRLTY